MALSITGIQRVNGAQCDHLTVTVDHEGTSRQFTVSFGEIDALLADLSAMEEARMLVLFWAAYRRKKGRAVLNVVIA